MVRITRAKVGVSRQVFYFLSLSLQVLDHLAFAGVFLVLRFIMFQVFILLFFCFVVVSQADRHTHTRASSKKKSERTQHPSWRVSCQNLSCAAR
jgi:hypothetical protein